MARFEVIHELSEYLKMPIEAVQAKIMCDTNEVCARDWKQRNPMSHEKILDFYRATEAYLFDLARYDYFLQGWRERVPRLCRGRILDYGGGIGDMTIRCAERGLKDLTYYDLEGKTMDFAKFRFDKRGVKVRIIEASDEEDRLEGKYDALFCFDVLEHVTEPIKHAERLVKHLSTNGRLFVQVGGKNVRQPMHISSFDVEAYFHLSGLKKCISPPLGMVEYYSS
jgi:SAM-dependent methyltransferase